MEAMATLPVPSHVAKVLTFSFLSPSTSGRSLAAEMMTAKQVTKPVIYMEHINTCQTILLKP